MITKYWTKNLDIDRKIDNLLLGQTPLWLTPVIQKQIIGGIFWLKVIEEINQFHLGAQGTTKTFAQDKFT